MKTKQLIIDKLENLIKQADAVLETQEPNTTDMEWLDTGVSHEAYHEWAVSALNLLKNYLGEHTLHYQIFKEYFDNPGKLDKAVVKFKGILKAAKDDYENGFLIELDSYIKTEIIQDVLDRAERFLEDSYKDAAGITATVALESALKAICSKNDIKVKDVSKLNDKLKESKLYNVAKCNQIDSWLRFKDNADEYGEGEVRKMIEGVNEVVGEYL